MGEEGTLPRVPGSPAWPLLSRGTLRSDRRVGRCRGRRHKPIELCRAGRGEERAVRKDLLSRSDRSGSDGECGRQRRGR
jgi:hypothetical protein